MMPKMTKIPADVRFITHGIDVHEGRVTFVVFGWDGAGKSCLLASATVDVPATVKQQTMPVYSRPNRRRVPMFLVQREPAPERSFLNLHLGEPWTPPEGE